MATWVWLAAPFGAGPALAAAANYQGLWWNPPAESGWGINFAHQGDIIFATWFTYDAAGKPWWLIAELHKTAAGRLLRARLDGHRAAVQRGPVRPGARSPRRPSAR